MMIRTQNNNSQKIKIDERDNKITQYFPSSNIELSKENNTVAKNKTNENQYNKENKVPPIEIKSQKSKFNYSSLSSAQRIIIEKISKIYENFISTKNILQSENNFLNILKNKIRINEDNKTPPLAINEEGSLILKSACFWILFIHIKLNKITADFQAETFFTFFENATECCEENKNILCDFFYEFIQARISHDEIINRIKINVPNYSFKGINFSEIPKKDYKYALQNYKFFDFDKIFLKSAKNRKHLSEQNFIKNKRSILPEVCKNEQSYTNLKILEIGCGISFEIDKFSFEYKHENKINLKLLYGEIINNQKLCINSRQISHDILNLKNLKKGNGEILKIDNQTSFSIFPHYKVSKRISFINNFEQEAGSLPVYNHQERDLKVALLEKIEIYRDIESYNTTKTKRCKSFELKTKKVYNMDNKISKIAKNTSSNKIVNKYDEDSIINKRIKSKSSAKNKSKVKARSKTNKTHKKNNLTKANY